MAGENRNGAITLDFGDGSHVFRLAFGELEELQEKTGIGPLLLRQRMVAGEWFVGHVRETIRLGLIGGGMEAIAALTLVRRYADERPDWIANAVIASLILLAALAGSPEEEPGKGDAPEDKIEASISPTDALPSENSTQPPEPSE
jgi:hypothetical protein